MMMQNSRHFLRSMLLTAIATLAIVVSSPRTKAAVMFEFNYSNGSQFTVGALGQARRTALEEAATALGSIFAHTATIQLTVTTSNSAQSDTLASAASEPTEVSDEFFGFAPGVVQNKILTGVDSNGVAADGSVDVNFGQPWDLDDQISPNEFDFKATMIHELLHAVGFSSSIFSDGTDIFETPVGEPGVWSTFDKFIAGTDGVAIIDDDFALNGAAWNGSRTGGASPGSGLFFNGPRATTANGGVPVGLYSPSEWEEGSSGSHLDDQNPALNGMVMLSSTDTGLYTREFSAIERAMLEDLGYSLSSNNPSSSATLTIQSSSSGLDLTITGDAGDYAISRSNDLQSWSQLTTVSIAQDGQPATYSIPPGDVSGAAYFTAESTD
ncbi:MAG: hypothetical protein ACI9R3_003538 [Verrucomicrobiales bacterium]|jgi:hypothetical protein